MTASLSRAGADVRMGAADARVSDPGMGGTQPVGDEPRNR